MALWLRIALLPLLTPFAMCEGQTCGTRGGVFFDFQVERRALYAGDTTLFPRPASAHSAIPRHAPLVQFVVDSAGRAIPSSLKFLDRRDSGTTARVTAVIDPWHFAPAISRGCKVSQLVQIPLIDTLGR